MAQPQLAIRIAANVTELKKNLAEGRAQIEALGPSVQKMAATWAAQSAAVIQNARNITAAVAQMGDKTITAAQAAKNLKALETAMDQLRASGQAIPPMMQQAADKMAAMGASAQKAAVEVDKHPSIMDRVNTKAVAMGAAFGTFVGGMAWTAVNKLGAEIGEFAQRGFQLNAVQQSFERLASGINANASEMLGSMKGASRGLVAEFDLMKAANKAMLLGLPVSAQSMQTLTAAATTLGRAMGQDATKSVDDLITALGRSSPMILDNLGITVKVGEANEAYAAKLNKTAEQLTDAEKKTAFYEAAMAAALAKTKELGDQTSTLGEILQSVWTSFGNVVTGVVSNVNVGIGSAMSSMKNFGLFLDTAMKAGIPAAVTLMATMEQVKGATAALSASQQLAATALNKNGESIQQIAKYLGVAEASVKAYLDSLKKAPSALDNFGNKNKETAKKVGESWSGAFGDIFNYSKAWQAEQDAMAASMSKVSWSGTAADIDKFNFALRETLNLSTGISWSGVEADLTNLRGIFNNEGKASGDAFFANFSAALANLGSVIVGAIQGGGNVGKSIFASLGAGLGADLGASITKSLTASLGKGLAGAIGGLLGPLGALGGSLIGGLFDKMFGNQGRSDAKGFAASFGGFDALQAKMLTLGPAYDKLWRDLTQNTKGPAQVAAAIKAIEDAFRAQEAAANSAAGASASAFAGPAGAAGFPTRAQLQAAAADAKAAYDYMLESGLYTSDVLTQAWNQWQDALIAAGDKGAAALRKIDAEMETLRAAIAEELPEYDTDGIRIYGVIEQQNIDRLAALEAERAAAALVQVEEEQAARAAAAATADTAAQKSFDDAVTRAKVLDGELKKLFSAGYDVKLNFNGSAGGYYPPAPAGAYGGAMAAGGSGTVTGPTWFLAGEAGREQYAFSGANKTFSGSMGGDQTIMVQVGEETLVRAVVKGAPRFVKLRGRAR